MAKPLSRNVSIYINSQSAVNSIKELKSEMDYRDIKSVPGLSVTKDALFKYNGKTKKPIYCHTVNGRKASVRLIIMIDGKSHYWQAAKLVAEAWKTGYEPTDYITYRDGDCHNITANNLVIEDKKGYYEYMRRNSGNVAAGVEERKRKLQLVIDEATMTLNYFKTLKMDDINKHVETYLYKCLMDYTINTLHLGERVALEQVPNALATMYECIMNGMCLYNYERYCKKLLLKYKKKGTFGHTGNIPKPIKIEVEQLNLDCLWERYKVTSRRK